MLARVTPEAIADSAPAEWRAERGACRVIYVYDLGWQIQLSALEPRVADWRRAAPPAPRGREPQRIEIRPEPLRLEIPTKSVAVGPFLTNASAAVKVYEFGAVSIVYTIPIRGNANDLIALSRELVDNHALLEHSRKLANDLLDRFGDTVTRGSIWSGFEDYVVFHVEDARPAMAPGEICERFASSFAQILRSESAPLAAQEVDDALSARISFGRDDISIFDWNAALVIDAEVEDALGIVEFANVQLLEARFLDEQLDRSLERAYEVLSQQKRMRGWPRPAHGEGLWRVAELQIEGAVLFGRVTNALKLVGEQYLARVYRLLYERFHIAEWNAGVSRKLSTIESIYAKLSDRAATRRMEILEWIIILLFVASILVSLAFGH
jgi:hypothetical protein